MKKSFVVLALAVFSLSACDNSAENQSKEVVKDFTDYVDSIQKITPEYTNTFWENIEKNFEKKEAKAEAVRANLEESTRKDIDEGKAEFVAFKERYLNEKNKYEQKLLEDKKNKIRAVLFGENNVSPEMNYGWVTASNIAEVYQKFVDGVDANKKDYSEANWEFIKDTFKSLDDRRDEISNEISGKDKLKITEQKVRFGAIKAVN